MSYPMGSKWQQGAEAALAQADAAPAGAARTELFAKAQAYATMHAADKIDDVALRIRELDQSLEMINTTLGHIADRVGD